MYKVGKKISGKRLSLFHTGFPKSILINDKTPQKALKILYELGVEGIVKDNNNNDSGSDNKK